MTSGHFATRIGIQKCEIPHMKETLSISYFYINRLLTEAGLLLLPVVISETHCVGDKVNMKSLTLGKTGIRYNYIRQGFP